MNASEKSEAIALHKAQGSVHVPHTTAEGTRNVEQLFNVLEESRIFYFLGNHRPYS